MERVRIGNARDVGSRSCASIPATLTRPVGSLSKLAEDAPLAGSSLRPHGDAEPIPRPPVEDLELDAYALSTGLDLERTYAGQMKGSPDRAYATKLYRTLEEALADVPARTLDFARRSLHRHPEESEEASARRFAREAPLPIFNLLHLRGAARGRDYRPTGCQIKDPFDQLAYGEGTESAWHVVRRDRDAVSVYVARIPDGTPAGRFFGFLAGCGGLAAPIVGKAPRWTPPNLGVAPWAAAMDVA
jgi:hypothetical protein